MAVRMFTSEMIQELASLCKHYYQCSILHVHCSEVFNLLEFRLSVDKVADHEGFRQESG